MQKNRGALVIEASIAMTAFIFLILFFLNFAQIYQAQSFVSHQAFQTSQTLAVESFPREKVGESGTLEAITKVMDFYAWATGADKGDFFTEGYRSLGTVGDLNAIVREEFIRSYGESHDNAYDDINTKLKRLGIVDGFEGLDFSGTTISSSVIEVHVTYKVQLKFSFFGLKEVTLHKTACSKSFAKISEDNSIPVPTVSNSSS